MFLPIARDSLISGEHFMTEVMEGLGSCLDFDLEELHPQSRMSAFSARAVAAAVRGMAPSSSTAPAPQDSPCGIQPPPRALGPLGDPIPRMDESMDTSIAFIKQEGVVKVEPTPPVVLDTQDIAPVLISDDEEDVAAEKPAEDREKGGPSE